jgi:hypothetical protein
MGDWPGKSDGAASFTAPWLVAGSRLVGLWGWSDMAKRESRYIGLLPGGWTALCQEEVSEVLRCGPTRNELAIYFYLASVRKPDFAVTDEDMLCSEAGYRTIERYTGIPKNSVARAVGSMEGKGLVRREAYPHKRFGAVSLYSFPCLERVLSSGYRYAPASTPACGKEGAQNHPERKGGTQQRVPRYAPASTGGTQQRVPGVCASEYPLSQKPGILGHTISDIVNPLHKQDGQGVPAPAPSRGAAGQGSERVTQERSCRKKGTEAAPSPSPPSSQSGKTGKDERSCPDCGGSLIHTESGTAHCFDCGAEYGIRERQAHL